VSYAELEREAEKQRRVVDWTPRWEQLQPLGSVNGTVEERVRQFCTDKRIRPEALIALDAKIKIDKHGGVCLAFAGYGPTGQVVAIKYRPLDGSSHDSRTEAPSTWLLPPIIGMRDATEWYIVEGETDTARILDLVAGGVAVLCLPAGARTFKREWAELVPPGATVYLLHDADADGDAGAEKAARIIGSNAVRVRPPVDGGDWCDWPGTREQFAELVAAAGCGKATLEVLSARELCALPDPPEDEQVLGQLLRRGQRLVLGAHTGEGKTSMALQIVRASTAKGEFLDWRGCGGRVLVLDAEQGLRTVKRRLREAGLDECGDVDYVRVPDGLALDSDERDVAEAEQVLEQGNYTLVVADPLYKLHTGDSNAEREAVDLMRRFDGWRERFGFALLLPVHCRKPVPGMKFSIHDLFGSSAYVRGAEVVLGLRRVSDGYAKLHFLKDRDGDLPIGASWGLLFDQEEGFRRDPNDGVVRDLREELLELLADGEWWTPNELRKPKDEGGIGADRAKVRSELEAMTGEGLLEFELGPEGRRKDAKCWRRKWRETPDATSATSPQTSLDGEAEGRSGVVASPIRDDTTDATSTDTERAAAEVAWGDAT
jgi:hypothetical protein